MQAQIKLGRIFSIEIGLHGALTTHGFQTGENG